MRFANREEAGRRLASIVCERLSNDIVVVGLPRGGVPVAAQVASALDAPLDVVCVRKLGVPSYPELAMGAIGEGGVRVLDHDLVARLGIADRAIAAVETRERDELARQAEQFRAGRAPVALEGRTVVIVDDGLATGATARAAARSVRARGARRVVLAVPVGARDSMDPEVLGVDDVIAVVAPRDFGAVGAWYDDFRATSDAEVLSALHGQSARGARQRPRPLGPAARSAVTIPAGEATLDGWLDVPQHVRGLVVFVHGSGSSRMSPRNQAVAAVLNEHGFATLLFDLLTDAESADRRNVFDVGLLARRLRWTLDWAATRSEVRDAPVGLFGASTGAAAAIMVAAAPDARVDAVVSRGGRPDLAEDALGAVRCPVLLIVGGADRPTFVVNELAAARLHVPHVVEIVPGAGHLFEEPGALEHVADLAVMWFERWLARSGEPPGVARGRSA